jgi:hypothetical protein
MVAESEEAMSATSSSLSRSSGSALKRATKPRVAQAMSFCLVVRPFSSAVMKATSCSCCRRTTAAGWACAAAR